jgi:hypothetical protein
MSVGVSGARLSLADFVTDPATGVLLPPGAATPAGYLDGAERALLEGLPGIADRGTGSDELRTLMRDWPTSYHLTPYRATILDCLGFARAGAGRVLELGAGCGAVTRWLGEHFAEVHAVEGSASRAQVIRERCADLDSVRVYSANYSELDERAAFDLVTLVGVLEYGHLYHPEHCDPRAAAVANLATARDALTDSGALVLAIENRLGLKYLNGAREDHSGRLFEGVQGYQHAGTPVTFSARELRSLLAEAGFAAAEFLLPFPDYKLARTIVNPAACADEHRIHNWLAGPAPDRGAERGPLLYNESLAVREVAEAGLLTDLANSFLVVAFPSSRDASAAQLGLDLSWAARHYSLDRRIGLRKRATLRGAVVEHEPAPFGDAPAVAERAAVAAFGVLHEPAPEPFRRGELQLLAVLGSLAGGELAGAFAAHVREHRDWLLERYGTGAGDGPLPAVAGEAFDVTWWNVVVDPAGAAREVIDGEWRLTSPVPVDFVVWRMLHHFFLRHRVELPAPLRELSLDELVRRSLDAAGLDVPAGVLDAFAQLERELSAALCPGPLPEGPSAALATVAGLDVAQRALSVVAFADEVAAMPGLLSAYAGEFGDQDPLTLLLYAPDAEPEDAATSAEAALAAAGLGDDAPDMMLLPVPGGAETEAALAADAVAVLSDRPQGGALAALPCFGRAQVDALRAFVDAVRL